MSDESENFNSRHFESFLKERTRWATLSVTIQEIADDNKELIKDLSTYDQNSSIPLLASLLTLPEYQSHCIRMEILVALALVFCRGKKVTNRRDIARWFSEIGESECVSGEDPAEDVFISLVQNRNGDFRLIEGVWEAAGFYTQRILDVISTMPDSGLFGYVKHRFKALLVISDLICEKAGLSRYQLGSDSFHPTLSLDNVPNKKNLIRRVTVSLKELKKRGVEETDIEPFVFDISTALSLKEQRIGNSDLDRRPLIRQSDTEFIVLLPTAISVAARDFVFDFIVDSGLVEDFDNALARNYSDLFADTQLLGGSAGAPVYWKDFGLFRLSKFAIKIDEGYYISYHLFLPSIETHSKGGFKSIYQDEGDLTNEIQKIIDQTIGEVSGEDGFKEGLIVVVGCGWGKGYATQYIELNYPQFHFQSMSAADLIRLSWLDGMSPSYLWRVQDGLEVITKSGVNIINPNGILNLIGWVRSNDGHFVPHAQLPEGEISSERPFMISPPLNLLREVRAQSDQGYDRHRALDNSGIWHEVQHISPEPFFDSESVRRLYASMSDTRKGILTTLYEGGVQLWLSLSTPHFTDKGLTYRLWEMSNEWLHRIGREFDECLENFSEIEPIKVYVEFLDEDPAEEPETKPRSEGLILLCATYKHKEKNARKVIFKAGFLNGFSIAENIAEQLFVSNIVHAFLQILDLENIDIKAEEIAKKVTSNQEARHFHIFHAQKFLDFVQDTLPKKLVYIDEIDDAAAKIGLGWRAIKKRHGNKIEGRGACTRLLNSAVDILISETIAMLAPFERVSTLKRLIANCEKARDEEDHWKRTSAAVIGLHGKNKNTINRFVEQVSKFAGAGISTRILAELALCACPNGQGAKLSNIELSKLIARTSLIIRLGGLSNAIYYNALPPEIVISPLGDILFKDEFGQMVVQPMLSRNLGEKFIASSSRQKKNYEEPLVTETTQDKIDAEFWAVWKVEMGFDLDDARKIIGALEDIGISRHEAIFTIKRSECLSIVCSNEISENLVVKFLEKFTLPTRDSWHKPPKGFEVDDIEPWRFGRKLSLVTRPILCADNSDDPLLIVSPASLREGVVYVVDGAYRGSFKQSFFETPEMKEAWWGKASEGHSFNAEVAKRLDDAGWQTRENIGIPEILNRKIKKDYGDVDVLAWRKDRSDLLAIECKDLSFARNYSEIAALLSNYQGKYDRQGNPDRLKKHIDRIDMLNNDLDELTRFTGIQEPKIVTCLVCSGVVPMQYAKIEALSKIFVGSIDELLAL